MIQVRTPVATGIRSVSLAVSTRGSLVLALLFILSLPAVTPRLYASDEIEYFAYLRSLWFDRDLSFENEYRYFYDRGIARAFGFRETFLELTTETGRRPNFATIGCALLWAPFYALGDLVARTLAAAGWPAAVDGFSRPYLAAVTYGSALYGFLGVWLSVVAARRIVGQGHLAALLVWLGTPLLFYMYVAPGMSHANSAFAVAAFVVAWLRIRERWSIRGLAGLGALAALMGMVREQDLFFAVGPAVDFVWTLAQRLRGGESNGQSPRQLLVNGLVGAVTFAVVYLPQAVAYIILNGRLGPSQVVARKMVWTPPHALQVLASGEHGFFLWTPLALLGIAGLVILVTGKAVADRPPGVTRRIATLLLLMLAAQVYVSGSVDSWSAAGTFGQRRFVALTVLLVIGLAALFRASRTFWSRRSIAVAIALCIWWNVGLMAQFGSGMMDRQRLELSRNAYGTFVAVPRSLPQLAYRYFFDRQSFYSSSQD